MCKRERVTRQGSANQRDVCPDGFPLSPNDPVHDAQLRLNEYLLGEEQRNPALTAFDVAIWRKLGKRQLLDQVRAVLERLAFTRKRPLLICSIRTAIP